MHDAYETAECIKEDIDSNQIVVNDLKQGYAGIIKLLQQRNVQTIDINGWNKIDQYEINRGQAMLKLREKIVDHKELINTASSFK